MGDRLGIVIGLYAIYIMLALLVPKGEKLPSGAIVALGMIALASILLLTGKKP